MKQLAANSAMPNAVTMRLSTYLKMSGRKGKIASCGSPSHICTTPICKAL